METVRELRKRRRLTQERLAQLCECHGSMICQYETGRAVPRFKRAERMAEALGVSLKKLHAAFEETARRLQPNHERPSASMTTLPGGRERREGRN